MEDNKIEALEHNSLYAMTVELTTLSIFNDRDLQAFAIFAFPKSLSKQKKVIYLKNLVFKLSDLLEEKNSNPKLAEGNVYEDDLRLQLKFLFIYLSKVNENFPERYSTNSIEDNKRIVAAFQEWEINGARDWLNNSIDKLIQTLITFISVDDFNFNRTSQSQIVNVKQQIKDDIASIDKLKEQAQTLVSHIEMLPSKLTIDGYSEMFSNEASNFGRASKWWLFGVFICFGGIVLSSIVYSTLIAEDEFTKLTLNQLVQFNITKALTLAALFYGLAICNKNFKSSKHNQIVNKHRSNALASFQAFVEAPSADQATKNSVLLEATKTIYSSQTTGYLRPDNEDSPNKIVEVIQNLQPKHQ
ncbi:hypothetical protein [Dyadobacter sp.]|uniref:hypothetical protein n=1 Tax=Dyadobacter sp. TaxID=1914288 RepID=UPI003F7169AA